MLRTRTILAIIALIAFVLAPSSALAADGSLVRGVVWADLDSDGLHESGEPLKAGITVQLVRASTGAVVATTITNGQGVYRFDDVANGTYLVRVTAPGAYDFPDQSSGDNSFATSGQPTPGAPELGVTAPITINGATQATGLDAGMQPVANISVQELPMTDACEGVATTGTPPFDTGDGGGKDSSTSNCLIRTNDTETQRYAVSLTGLPTGVSVDNVVLDLKVTSADGAFTQLAGPGANGLPTGCLTSGVTPASSVTTNADGSVSVRCNLGTFTSAVKAIQLVVRSLNSSSDKSHFHVEAWGSAAAGDAAPSDHVVGPDIEVTGIPHWDLSKRNMYSESTVSVQTINGKRVRGYLLWYMIRLDNTATGQRGGRSLELPLEFTDKLTRFPEAVIQNCYPTTSGGDGYYTSGTLICPPQGTPQGADGWPMKLTGLSPLQNAYLYHVQIFVPEAAVYQAIDPNWKTGDPLPSGSVPVGNAVIDTEGWTDSDGVPNNGTGFEPGWDGTTATGNNVVTNAPLTVSKPVPGLKAGSGKFYFSPLGGCCAPGPLSPGKQVGTTVLINTNSDTTITNPMLCDVFDLSTLKVDVLAAPPAGYLFEYAAGPNADDLQAGPKNTQGKFPYDSQPLKAAADGCGTYSGPWSSSPQTAFGANWQDKVNMIRMRPIDPTTTLGPDSTLQMWHYLRTRGRYNGGPHDGELIPAGAQVPNEGGWTDPGAADGWSTNEAVLDFVPLELTVSKSAPKTQYLPGDAVPWTIKSAITNAAAGATALGVTVTDTLPADLAYDPTCTAAALPAGVTVSYNPATRAVVFSLGDRDVPAGATSAQMPDLKVCTTLNPLAKPGSTLTNLVKITAPNSSNAPANSASIQVNGTGALSIQKSVDKALVTSGQTFTWNLDWGNTSAVIDFAAPDVIDVLPWNGDSAATSLSRRTQYSSDYQGSARLTGALPQPTYTSGGTGNVAGTWYYATAAPSTINHSPADPSNANAADPGGLWQTASETANGQGFAAVTAVRFVSAGQLTQGQQVRATVPQKATSTLLDNVYVNRARLFSSSVPNQTLLSNEPYVLMPGFTLGDLIWRDDDGDGVRDDDEPGIAGVPVEILDSASTVVATTTTSATGRWSVSGLPEGSYRVHVPASAFLPGGALDGYTMTTVGSSTSNTENEGQSNNNNPGAGLLTVTGVTSTPIAFSYTRDAQGNITGGNGPLGDDLAGLSDRMTPDDFSNFTLDLAMKPVPSITIVKSTQGQDANDEPGPLVRVGDTVRWTYVVTNTGNTELVNVAVGDDQLPVSAIDCGNGSNVVAGPLAPGKSVTCTATGTATLGQYENNGSATAEDPDTREQVFDVDPSHYLGIAPDVRIVKSTQGDDANASPGPAVRLGATVRWSYQVTNTGNAVLTDLAVTDDKVESPDIDCGHGTNVVAGPLAPGDSFTCTATGTAVAGQYANTGTVVGTAPPTLDENGGSVPGDSVTDDDPSHYHAFSPQLKIVKSTNGDDANAAPGPQIKVGDAVRWTYEVRNTGDVDLTDVKVSDDKIDDSNIDCGDGSNFVAGPLAPGESFTCSATGTAVAGQYANTGTATGTAPPTVDEDGEPVPGEKVSDDDPSHYHASSPAVRIVKRTQGHDANKAPGPMVRIGDAVRWTYLVTNTGDADLRDLVVTDDKVDATDIDCGDGDNVVAGPLAPGDSFTCTATGAAVAGQYANTGTVVADAPPTVDVNGDPVPAEKVTDDDPSHYIAPSPELTIAKSTQGDDANAAPGPTVAIGDPVRWTYLVTNTGDVPLTDVSVTDDKVAPDAIDCGGGSNVVATLATGDSVTCTATGDAVAGQYANTGTATGTAPPTLDVDGALVAGETVSADDPSHYFAPDPSVRIVKSTNTFDANEAPGPRIKHGTAVLWTYVVTNTGNTDLSEISVTDDKVDDADIDCGDGSNVVPGPLAAGDSVTCTATGVAEAGQYENTGTVVATPPSTVDVHGDPVPGAPVTDDDPSHYFGTGPGVRIVKSTNGDDANDAPGPAIKAGDRVRWTYAVTNTGAAGLFDVTVTDDKVAATDIDCGDGTNVIAGPVAPGATVSCTASGVAEEGPYENTGTVVATAPPSVDEQGQPVPGEQVTDDDPSHYHGVSPEVQIVKSTNGEDANDAPGPAIKVGGEVQWTYVITNTGTAELTDLVVHDDRVDDSRIDCGDGSDTVAGPLRPGDSFICTANGVARAGQYENLGTVSANGPTVGVDGSATTATVTDTDPSHYHGQTDAIRPPKEPKPPTGHLPNTGGPNGWIAVLGILLILAGAWLVLLASRRERS